MVAWDGLVLGLHVAAGAVALFAGLGAIATTKGGRRHRRFGRAYVYAMGVVVATALALYGIERTTSREFLALIAVFSGYFALSGYRVLARRRTAGEETAVDWTALAAFGVASLAILATGGRFWLAGRAFAPVLLAFGAIGTGFGVRDLLAFSGRRAGGTWVGEHVFRMGAAYIATVTAVSSVNLLFLPVVVRWLWPTTVGVPLIALAIRHYESAFGLAES